MPTSTPRVGLIGAGGISHAHVPAWLALGATVTAYSQAGASRLAERYSLGVADSIEALLASCDIVDICTPTPSHLDYIESALLAGKHVICEKPVSLDLEGARRVGRLATERSRHLYPAHVVRFFPEYALAKRAVDDGAIGDVAVMRFSRIGEYPTWSEWFSDIELSGGIVVDQMIHDLDIARWIAGDVVEVYATRAEHAAEASAVSAHVVLTHEGGAVGHVNGVWGATGTTFRTSFSIAGSDGLLERDSRDDASLRLDFAGTTGGATDRPDSSFTESPYLTELREFLDAIQGGPAPRVSWDDGIRAVEIAAAANRSIATGLPVVMATVAERSVA